MRTHFAMARVGRLGSLVFARLFLAFLLVLALALWLLGREATLQALARQITAINDGALVFKGVSGSLYGPMQIDQLTYRSPERTILVEKLALDWTPWQLFGARIVLDRVSASNLRLTTLRPSEQAAQLPKTLALPMRLSLRIDSLQVASLELAEGGQTTRFQDLRAVIGGDQTQWRLRQAIATSPWGELAANASVGSAHPFALDGKASLTTSLAANPAKIDVGVGGNLSQLTLSATLATLAGKAALQPGALEAKASLTPFAPQILRALSINGQGLNPASLHANWPQADVSVDLSLQAASQTAAPSGLSGKLVLINHAPATLDKQGLPLRRIDARLHGAPGELRVDELALDFGKAGQLLGSGGIADLPAALFGPTMAGQTPPQRVRLQLHTGRFDLQALHGRLRGTKIAGDLRIGGSDARRQTLDASLREANLQLTLHASLEGTRLQVREARLHAGNGDVSLSGDAQIGGAQEFQASGSLTRFDPAQFGAFPAADLNADFRINGKLAPDWQVTTAFDLLPSRWFAQNLRGKGKFEADARHVRALDVRLALGDNTLEAKGGLGAPDDRVNWRIEAKNLAGLRTPLTGALSANGVLRGGLQQAVSSIDLLAQGLRWQDTGGKREGNAEGKSEGNGGVGARGVLRVKGELAWAAAKGPASAQTDEQFNLGVTAEHIDPAAFGAYPRGDINAVINAKGRFADDWRIALDLQLANSTLQAQALAGRAKFKLDARQIADADLDLRLGGNTLQATGNFGGVSANPANRGLTWRIDAPRLATLGPQIKGALSASGTLAGTMDWPQATLELAGNDLDLPGQLAAKSLRAKARFLQGKSTLDSPFNVEIALVGAQAKGVALQALTLEVGGTLAAHKLHLQAQNASMAAKTDITGGLSSQDGQTSWVGKLALLENQGDYGFALQAPVPLRVVTGQARAWSALLHPDQISLGELRLILPSGGITLQALEKNGSHWHSHGVASGLPLAYFSQSFAALHDNLESTLKFGVNWKLDIDQTINGTLKIFREGGDAKVGPDLPIQLGLNTLEARADVIDNAVRLQLDLAGSHAGRVHLDANSQFARRDGSWRLPFDSPLRANASVDMPDIGWLAPLSGQPGLEIDGKLALAMSATGTLGAPVFSGQLNGDQLGLRWISEGFTLRNGQLRAQLSGDRILLRQFRFDGGQGEARAEGSLRYANGQLSMQAKLSAEHLQILSRPDRLLVVSGAASATLDQKRLRIQGKLKAERALIELAAQDSPTLSDDVVVLGASAELAASAKAKKAAAVPVNLEIEADLGENFRLRGKGLDARLAGTIRIEAIEHRSPRAIGSIRIVEGNYAAYGQKLQIEHGMINFTGAMDNPGINILALRKRLDPDTGVEAGVELHGTALAPVAKLVSTPTVPDSEKLSWLVLGHGIEGAAGQEFDALSAAAGALFGTSQAASLQTRLANALGLDEIGMSRAKGLESTVLTFGKQISKRAYLSFEQGASSASSLVKLRYVLNSRLSLQAQTGTNNALDLLYTWVFD